MKYLLFIKVIFLLIYSLPVYYFLPTLLFEIIGYLSIRKLSKCLASIYVYYSGIEFVYRMLMIPIFMIMITHGWSSFLGISLIFQVVLVSILSFLQTISLPIYCIFYSNLERLRPRRH